MPISPEDAIQSTLAKNGGLAGQSPDIGGKPITKGADMNLSELGNGGMGNILPKGLDAMKGIQEINNTPKISNDKSIADMKTNQGISSGGQGHSQ